MRFCDEGVVLGGKVWGNSQYVVSVLTRDHGLSAGLLRVGRSQDLKAALRGGTCVKLSWQGRLEEHLGRWTFEDVQVLPYSVWEDGGWVTLVELASGLARKVLADRDIQTDFYEKTRRLMGLCGEGKKVFLCGYSLWELELLRVAGMGLDREKCAVTGAREGLCYLSPRTGRAVSEAGAGGYASRLLMLPEFWSECVFWDLLGGESVGKGWGEVCESVGISSIVGGLATTGHFLSRYGFLEGVCGVLRERVMEELRA